MLKSVEDRPTLYKKLSALVKFFRVRREIGQILTHLHNGKIKTILIVYDTLISPPTYGDFFYTVMFARYFTSKNISVNFVIVDGDTREDWSVYNDVEKNSIMTEYMSIARVLLDPDLAVVEVLTSPQLQARVRDGSAKGVYVPFRENVINRIVLYTSVMDTLNCLWSKSIQSHLDRFLLSYEELNLAVPFRKPNESYITWGCRLSNKTAFDRNTSEENFVLIYARLKSLYPNHEIMIVSDALGCNYFKSLADKYGLTCLFSKDYSGTLMGDGGLILGSAYFFMQHCGGIIVFPWFSRVPYEMVISLVHEKPLNINKLYSWASKNQIWRSPFGGEHNLPALELMPKRETNLQKPV